MPCVRSSSRDPRHQRHVRAGQDRQADDVDVLLERRGRDHLGRLAEARVDDLEALVAEAAREHLGAAVVAVEAGLGDEHLERSVGHGRDCRPAEARPATDLRSRPEWVSGGSGGPDRRHPPSVHDAHVVT